MNIAAIVLRWFVGLPFLVFGLNYFVPFMAMDPGELPEAAKTYAGALASTKIMTVVKALEVIGGLLLILGRFVPLGLVILVPVTVNIALWDALIMKFSMPPLGTILLVAEIVLIALYWVHFKPLLNPTARPGR